MKAKRVWAMTSAAWMGLASLAGQEANEIEQLKRQLRDAQESFERIVQEQRRTIDDLSRRIEALDGKATALPGIEDQSTSALPPARPTDSAAQAQKGEDPAVTAEPTPGREGMSLSPAAWRPSDPIPLIGRGPSYANLSLDGLFAAGGSTADDLDQLQLGGHDPNQNGFTVQNVELVIDGAVDPFFRGQGNVVFFINPQGESVVELEEAYVETLSLPWNLQAKAGQYFTEFGRHNPTHPHTWSFVDSPLVNGRFFGGDGLRNPGARLAWLMPTPFYSELSLSAQNSHGETASSFRSAGHSHSGEEPAEGEVPFAYRHPDNDRGFQGASDLLFAPRYAVSFDLTPSQTVLLGASAAFGPNSSGDAGAGDTTSQIYGADLTWKWKSPRHSGGFPFVQWQTEAMLRKYDAGAFDWAEEGEAGILDGETGEPAVLAGERLTDYGFYTQMLYGFKKGWVAGLRFDYVGSDEADYEKRSLIFGDESLGRDPQRARRWRLSPNLTWYPSEFSKLRLQYNYDDRRGIGEDHSVWFQFEFLLGSHAAHKF